MRVNPAGWYRDSAAAVGHRYWDGEAWHDAAAVAAREVDQPMRHRRP